jgi:hypothetical protein
MFADACEIAQKFTRPVVISRRNQDGNCWAGIGAFVVVNEEGWAVTACHIMVELDKLGQGARTFQQAEATKAEIYANSNLDKKERGRRLKALPRFAPDAPTHSSGWWSWDRVQPTTQILVPTVDLTFVRLEPFNPAMITSYPVFKDPTKPMRPGTSLCRLGFPFHNIKPVFDASNKTFQLPAGSVPLPLFPLEGIHTRVVEVTHNITPPPPFKFRFIETSSPGLRGQSGGPIFDQKGCVWGIQSQTRHYPLGFSPPVPNGKPDEKEHQFLNVGWGVHSETLVGVMRDRGIAFALSDE